MMKYFVIAWLMFLSVSVQAETNETVEPSQEKEKTWWQLRQDRDDIFYPHKPHMDVMEDGGDACMLCHPFSKNKVHDKKMLEQLVAINNEALKAVCHDCHVEKMNAPSQCRLCHTQPSSIWPANHNYDYKNSHAQDAQADQAGCDECHKSLSFCTDCHFRRNLNVGNVHRLGYKTMHGLEARIAPAQCGACHQTSYCSDCHRRRK